MRKILKIIFITLSAIFFLKWLIPVKINIEVFYINIFYFIIAVPYVIYESKQLIKDDKINNTHTFRNRMLMILIAAAIMILSITIMNRIYQP